MVYLKGTMWQVNFGHVWTAKILISLCIYTGLSETLSAWNLPPYMVKRETSDRSLQISKLIWACTSTVYALHESIFHLLRLKNIIVAWWLQKNRVHRHMWTANAQAGLYNCLCWSEATLSRILRVYIYKAGLMRMCMCSCPFESSLSHML